jgi:hypothetical protein
VAEAEQVLDSAHQPLLLSTSYANSSGRYFMTPKDFGKLPVDEDKDGPRNGGLLVIFRHRASYI